MNRTVTDSGKTSTIEQHWVGISKKIRQVPKNKGEGFPGLDLNSGWNCTPMKYGWLGSSIICNISIPNINTEQPLCTDHYSQKVRARCFGADKYTSMRWPVSSLPAKERPAFSRRATISGLTCMIKNYPPAKVAWYKKI